MTLDFVAQEPVICCARTVSVLRKTDRLFAQQKENSPT